MCGETTAEAGDPGKTGPLCLREVSLTMAFSPISGWWAWDTSMLIYAARGRKSSNIIAEKMCVGTIDSAWQQNATNLSPHAWLPIKQALYDSMLD